MSNRLHIVLIPGFAGFDALGQLDYYAGVTPIFRTWRTAGRHSQAVLHYFDNFPTAGVSTRAGRLGRYLLKRIARGEFQTGDAVALVGHSTGGLDIRRLIWDLTEDPEAKFFLDGGITVRAGDLLKFIRKIVFLSVPQWGTNIAHWVRENLLVTKLVITELRGAVAASQAPVLHRVQRWISHLAAHGLNVDLFLALEDSLREAETRTGPDMTALADAHEAESQLELWLRHMAWDFGAIEDLTPPAEGTGPASPAHFSTETREREIGRWDHWHIARRSYATVAPRAFDFEPGKPAPEWHVVNPLTWPELTLCSPESVKTDISFRYCYRACAGGPLRAMEIPALKTLEGKPHRPLEVWDNDGIVNTISMLWPNGEDTPVVDCDHMDITGHFARPEQMAEHHPTRRYDLLGSASGFDGTVFRSVWNDVFRFCARETAVAAHA